VLEAGGKKAKFIKTDPLPIIVFANGIFLRRGPFRRYLSDHLSVYTSFLTNARILIISHATSISFQDVETRSFVSDVFDSYFPIEFRESHPDGVIFKVTDYSDTMYDPAKEFTAFSGRGRKVTDPKTLEDMGNNLKSLPVEEFLNRLPKAKILEDGSVVNIRADVEERIRGKKPAGGTVISVDYTGGGDGGNGTSGTTDYGQCDRVSIKRGETGDGESKSDTSTSCSPSALKVATLSVKSSDGTTTLNVRLKYTCTIHELRDVIDTKLYPSQDKASIKYEIRTSFPPRIYSEGAETLEEAGLVPNARVFLSALA
jgi:hypothetical protein